MAVVTSYANAIDVPIHSYGPFWHSVAGTVVRYARGVWGTN